MGWTIKQMSQITGLTADTLRYYDKLKIVSPRRMDNGYRRYDERNYRALQYITVMKYAHFSLSEIKAVIRSLDLAPSDGCNQMNRNIMTSKREELTERMRNIRRIIKLFDIVEPMIESADVYAEHAADLDDYVQKLYKDIMKSGEPQ